MFLSKRVLTVQGEQYCEIHKSNRIFKKNPLLAILNYTVLMVKNTWYTPKSQLLFTKVN